MRAGPGRLVVFEGGEGVGKSTQVARLVAVCAAAGVPAVAHREPGATPLGERVRALVLDPAGGPVAPAAEALLFMAARAQLVARIRDELAAGQTVVLDRFFLSTYAYQIAGRGLSGDLVRAANALATGGLVPDVTLLLVADRDVTAERLRARGLPDRMEQEDATFHARVGDAFVRAADPEWQRAHPEVGPVVAIDARGAPDDVARRVLAALNARWPETFPPAGESH